jgi:hypothetical protein
MFLSYDSGIAGRLDKLLLAFASTIMVSGRFGTYDHIFRLLI